MSRLLNWRFACHVGRSHGHRAAPQAHQQQHAEQGNVGQHGGRGWTRGEKERDWRKRKHLENGNQWYDLLLWPFKKCVGGSSALAGAMCRSYEAKGGRRTVKVKRRSLEGEQTQRICVIRMVLSRANCRQRNYATVKCHSLNGSTSQN